MHGAGGARVAAAYWHPSTMQRQLTSHVQLLTALHFQLVLLVAGSKYVKTVLSLLSSTAIQRGTGRILRRTVLNSFAPSATVH